MTSHLESTAEAQKVTRALWHGIRGNRGTVTFHPHCPHTLSTLCTSGGPRAATCELNHGEGVRAASYRERESPQRQE